MTTLTEIKSAVIAAQDAKMKLVQSARANEGHADQGLFEVTDESLKVVEQNAVEWLELLIDAVEAMNQYRVEMRDENYLNAASVKTNLDEILDSLGLE